MNKENNRNKYDTMQFFNRSREAEKPNRLYLS